MAHIKKIFKKISKLKYKWLKVLQGCSPGVLLVSYSHRIPGLLQDLLPFTASELIVKMENYFL